jgi:GntR family transcriptional regulator / MocR family aminotransferase
MLSEYLLSHFQQVPSGSALALNRQLYLALRDALRQGKVAAGERLPSSRDLAHDLQLSRNTVMTALQQLEAEGYVYTQTGSGTYVSDNIPMSMARPSVPWVTSAANSTLSKRAQSLRDLGDSQTLEVQPFTQGPPDFGSFPLPLWQKLQNKHWRMTYPDMLDYNPSGGFAPLRRAIADHLRLSRGLQLDSQQVIVTSGTQQSLSLCAQVLADVGDPVWVEDPLYWGAAKALLASGVELLPIAVDDQGMNLAATQGQAVPRLIYLTPSHQHPTGAVMTLARRHQILQQAHAQGSWIVEDDYDSEFRFSGPPLSSLQGLDPEGRVLYMGTFSKALYPGIKLAYLVVPKVLVEPFLQLHYDLNRPGQVPMQAAMAEFIALGHFATALRRARQHYSLRRSSLLAALQPCLAQGATISGAEQGLHLCLNLPSHMDDQALAAQAHKAGLTVRALSSYCLKRRDLRGLVIGYGYAPLSSIERDGPVLAQLVCGALG